MHKMSMLSTPTILSKLTLLLLTALSAITLYYRSIAMSAGTSTNNSEAFFEAVEVSHHCLLLLFKRPRRHRTWVGMGDGVDCWDLPADTRTAARTTVSPTSRPFQTRGSRRSSTNQSSMRRLLSTCSRLARSSSLARRARISGR